MNNNSIENIGYEFIKALFGQLEFDITEYCNAAIDEAFEYCLQEFKKACADSEIEWNDKWDKILNG